MLADICVSAIDGKCVTWVTEAPITKYIQDLLQVLYKMFSMVTTIFPPIITEKLHLPNLTIETTDKQKKEY